MDEQPKHERQRPEETFSILLEITHDNHEFATSLLNRLLEELPRQFEQIRLALERADVGQLTEAIHKLRGSACFFRLDGISSCAGRLGLAAHRVTPVEELRNAFHELEREVTIFLADHASPASKPVSPGETASGDESGRNA